MIVVGAGMAGLLAGAMLRDEATMIIEAQDEIPNNHSAVLRFRSSIVGDTLNIPFKMVKVLKTIHPWRNPAADALSYSIKTNGRPTTDRSIVMAGDGVSDRWIAPTDLVQRMVDKVSCPIQLGTRFQHDEPGSGDSPIISTMPMARLMEILKWKDIPAFPSISRYNLIVDLYDTNAYCSIYIPDPTSLISRVSITGNQLIAELDHSFKESCELPKVLAEAVHYCGIEMERVVRWEVKKQAYAKILPIDDRVRKQFIMWASDEHGVYSLGRYATWRPGLLMDDIVNDVRMIHRMINDGGKSYHHRKG